MIRSYVKHGNKTYLVSTINRESSSDYGGIYAETMVWEWDTENNKRASNSILMQDESCEDSIRGHISLVERIHLNGVEEK